MIYNVFTLFQNEANSMIRNVRGESTLDLASFYGRLETVSLLINEQPALLQQMQHSHSPLHLAARNGQKDVVRKLIQAGYNINCSVSSINSLLPDHPAQNPKRKKVFRFTSILSILSQVVHGQTGHGTCPP